MDPSNPLQERQLVLMETMNRRLESIQEGQKKLEEANASLRNENEMLRNQLERQQQTVHKSRRRKGRSQSNVEVPNDLRKRFRFVYKKMVEKKMTQGFIVTEEPLSERNQALFHKILEILKKENGGEKCPWTDLQMEAQYLRYFKTITERNQHIQTGTNEKHKEVCQITRRLSSKLERRLSGYDLVKAKLSLQERKAYDDVLYIDYMSSEESDYEDQKDPITGENIKRLVGYTTRKLLWERSRLTSLKSKLDKLHVQNLTPHARQMLKPRRVGGVSSRPSPEGPSWAVRQPAADV
ncbi:uncharacterized protein [Montipora capricornis]|uniref:uncharacterized protein n=1 Tax=Montipora capricornis TaxID=246305 RepID=UPI0035F130A2